MRRALIIKKIIFLLFICVIPLAKGLEPVPDSELSDEDAPTTCIYIDQCINWIHEGWWSKPEYIKNGFEAEVRVYLDHHAVIEGYELINSSGNASFDRDAIAAIKPLIGNSVLSKSIPVALKRHLVSFVVKFDNHIRR